VIGGAVFYFDAVEMGEDDEYGGQASTDLDAYDSSGLFFAVPVARSTPVALLYRARSWGVRAFEDDVKQATT